MAIFNSLDDTPSYLQHGAPVVLDHDATLTSVANYNGATLTLARAGAASPDDVFDATGTLSLSDVDVIVDGVNVGSFSNSGGQLIITFNGNATASLVNHVVEQLTYANGNVSPPSSVNINLTFDDHATSPATGGIAVGITATSDYPPVLSSVATSATYEPGTGGVLLAPQLGVDDQTSALLVGAKVTITDVVSATDVLFVGGGFMPGFGGINWTYSSATGVLSFTGSGSLTDYQQLLDAVTYRSTAPDPTSGGSDLTRSITWQASDSSTPNTDSTIKTTTLHFAVPPTITSNGGGDTAAIPEPENFSGVVTQVQATSSDPGATITYALFGGADVDKFQINSATGDLTFIAPPDFEAPGDADHNNSYIVQVGAIATSSATPDPLTDVQTITINVSNVNEAPVIVSNGGGDTASVSVAENTTAVTSVSAADPENNAVVYSIVGGTDAGKFQINPSSGALSFITPPNFEIPSDSDLNNSYIVQVQASDGALADAQTVTVNVVNANEAPTIVSNGGGDTASVSVTENSATVTTVTASDPDAGTTLTYTIVGGADASKFHINAASGTLSFVTAPDFDNPGDSDHDNAYIVAVSASDGSLTDTQTITVSVTNTNEPPTITSNGGGDTASVSVAENSTAVTTVAATDPDAGTTLTYAIAGGADASKFQIDAASGALSFVTAPDFDNPGDSDHNNSYIVQVLASDGSLTDTQTLTVNVMNVNEAPTIVSNGGGDTATVSAGENSTAVTTVAAADPDAGTTLAYAIIGGSDAAKLQIDAASGALSFINAPNFEHPSDSDHNNTYIVQVRASDGALTDTQTITVNVKDVLDVDEIDAGAYTDLGGDGRSDIILHNQNGQVAIWEMNGAQVKTAQVIGAVGLEWHVESTGDFTGDGIGDVVWRSTDGTVMAWQMNGRAIGSASIIGFVGTEWQVQGTGDLDGNGGADLVWRNDAGVLMLWTLNNTQIQSVQFFGAVGQEWHITGIGDFGGDNRDDILWRRDDGTVLLFQMNGTQIQRADIVGAIGTDWHVEGTPDLNGDGRADILWRNDSGAVVTWLMNGNQILSGQSIGARGSDWHVYGSGDFNGDGRDDILWRNDNGTVDEWLMNGNQVVSNPTITQLALDWTLGVHHYDFA